MHLFQDSQLISGDIKAHHSNNRSIASHQSLTLASEAEPCHPERGKKQKERKQNKQTNKQTKNNECQGRYTQINFR
jgi:hypothetical protein